jgi:hypothetical protein
MHSGSAFQPTQRGVFARQRRAQRVAEILIEPQAAFRSDFVIRNSKLDYIAAQPITVRYCPDN